MHSQIYSGLSLIFATLWNFRVAGANEFIKSKKVTLGPLLRSKIDENRVCITKKVFTYV